MGKSLFSKDQNSGEWSLTLTVKEYFLFLFFTALKNFEIPKSKKKTKQKNKAKKSQSFLKDFSTNPFLILIRSYFEHFKPFVSNSNQYGQTFQQSQNLKQILILFEEFLLLDVVHPKIQQGNKFTNFFKVSKLYNRSSKKQISNQLSIHIYEAIYLYIHYLQHLKKDMIKIYPINDEKNYQKLFYNFFQNTFSTWKSNSQENESTTISIIGQLWFKFLRPWEVYSSNPIDDLEKSSKKPKQLENSNLYDINAQSDLFQNQKLYSQVNQIIMKNILFFTKLFSEFLRLFSETHEPNQQDIQFLRDILYLYQDENGEINETNENERSFLRNHLKISRYGDFSQDIKDQAQLFDTSTSEIQFFANEDTIFRIKDIQNFFKLYKKKIQKDKTKQNSNSKKDDKNKQHLLKNINQIQNYLNRIFQLGENNENQNHQNNKNNNGRIRTIKQKQQKWDQYDWNHPLNQYENQYIYDFAKTISYKIDQISSKKSENNQPKTNLRKYVDIRILWFILFILMLVYGILSIFIEHLFIYMIFVILIVYIYSNYSINTSRLLKYDFVKIIKKQFKWLKNKVYKKIKKLQKRN